ncbi:MBL fold metallo-hydrolase [bacterium]|jgi:phosphoribosyl 1,2-cyclic phosphodiesterase|nr:MBL fold metallo-hydrolase [bacterium]
MKVTIWGTRGSVPISGSYYSYFGGNTTCVEIVSSDGIRCVIDAGTGIRDLGTSLLNELPTTMHLFLTHYHWDHCIGFPFFVPAFIPGNTIEIYGQDKGSESAKDILDGRLMCAPNFPVPLAVMGATLNFHRLGERGKIELSKDFTVEYAPLFHPNGVIGLRFTDKGRVFTYLTDIEHTSDSDEDVDAEPLELARDASVLAYDCQYTPDEYQTRVNWGHSTWRAGLNLSIKAAAKQMLMIHHDPAHTDDKVRDMLKDAQDAANGTGVIINAAYEGLSFEV